MEAAHTAFETRTCKHPGCTNDAVAKMGKFAGLCSEHIQARRQNEGGGQPRAISAAPARASSRRATGGSFAEKVRQLAKAARELDKLRAAATVATERALTAKRRADEAERNFNELTRELMGERS